MQNPIIDFSNFSFQYRAQSNPTLIDINLKINSGEKIIIAGPSGSGKSTLGYCINGLIPHFY
jgi:energy-coupling factor transport system ATP-binding protein